MRISHALLAAAAAAIVPAAAQAELIYGISVPGASTNLISFDSANPAGFSTVAPITGILAGHTLRGIDFRPSNGQLYALSTGAAATAAQVYTINLTSGVATPVGAGLTLTGNASTRVSLDFNPVVDAMRVITGGGQNYRVNPNTGALIAQDTSLPAANLTSGIAYTNNNVGASTTTLYGYDFITDNVGTIGSPSPNDGTWTIVGNSGLVAFNGGMGFDISGASGIAYLTMDESDSPGANAEFYTIDLTTGLATQVGPLDVFDALDISVAPVPEPGTLAVAALAGASLMIRRRRA